MIQTQMIISSLRRKCRTKHTLVTHVVLRNWPCLVSSGDTTPGRSPTPGNHPGYSSVRVCMYVRGNGCENISISLVCYAIDIIYSLFAVHFAAYTLRRTYGVHTTYIRTRRTLYGVQCTRRTMYNLNVRRTLQLCNVQAECSPPPLRSRYYFLGHALRYSV